MKILFCGTMVPEKIEYAVRDISAAGNRFQNNMIRNLEQMGHEVFRCVYLGIPVPEKEWNALERETIEDGKGAGGHAQGSGRQENAECLQNGRSYYVRKDGKLLHSIRAYRKMVQKVMSDTDAVICYNIIYAWLALPCWAKKRRNKSIAVLADYSGSESYRNLFMKGYARLQGWSMRRFDMVVGLSLNIGGMLRKRQGFVLMEGGIDRTFLDAFCYRPRKTGEPAVFLYAGLLNRVTGTDILLEAMQLLDRQDVRLIVTGKGDMEEEVKAAVRQDWRISYRGHLLYEEYVEQLQEANILINPRNMGLPENQNNFPSKIMDYMAAGKPVISTRFAGWEKFRENMTFFDCSAAALRDCMERAVDEPVDEYAVFRLNRKMAEQFEWQEQLARVLERE